MKFYMDCFCLNSFSAPLDCIHDVLAVAIGAGVLEPTLAPVVSAVVDTGHGPERGQTVCDLRSRYAGFSRQEGAHCRVVLDCDLDCAQELVDLLVAAGESALPLPLSP